MHFEVFCAYMVRLAMMSFTKHMAAVVLVPQQISGGTSYDSDPLHPDKQLDSFDGNNER